MGKPAIPLFQTFVRIEDAEHSVEEMNQLRRGARATAQDRRRLSLLLAWLWVSLVIPVLDELESQRHPKAMTGRGFGGFLPARFLSCLCILRVTILPDPRNQRSTE
jgi:hypothetical protein